jgi:SAM-dependent methyltransferase
MRDLPAEFDVEFYRTYDDLRELTDEQLRSHYESRGPLEGRLGSRWALRENFISLIPRGSRALEIGPFCTPSLEGSNVCYFDVLDREGLIEQALRFNFPSPNPPKINYVSPTGNLSVIHEIFDCVFSSHCIEHHPNLVIHLNEVANILAGGGRYFVVVPDKRFCFDHFRCESTIAAVIGAHVERRTMNTAKSAVEHRLLMTHNDPIRHWNGDHGEPAWWTSGIEFIDRTCREIEEAKGHHIETHAWHFTPDGFRTITERLYEFGLVKMRPIRVYQTPHGRCEFCAVLEKPVES